MASSEHPHGHYCTLCPDKACMIHDMRKPSTTLRTVYAIDPFREPGEPSRVIAPRTEGPCEWVRSHGTIYSARH